MFSARDPIDSICGGWAEKKQEEESLFDSILNFKKVKNFKKSKSNSQPKKQICYFVGLKPKNITKKKINKIGKISDGLKINQLKIKKCIEITACTFKNAQLI